MTSNRIKFKAVIDKERYYNAVSCFGIYEFVTNDDIPVYTHNYSPFNGKSKPIHKNRSVLTGNCQKLTIGFEYEIEAKVVENKKFGKQYQIVSIHSEKVFTPEMNRLFLLSLCTERQTENIIAAYPDFVKRVVDGGDIDISKIKGVGASNIIPIKEKIIENYVLSEVLTLLSPAGVTYNMIKKIMEDVTDPQLMKQKIVSDPYILTKIDGLGFVKVDAIALKLKPELKISSSRVQSFLTYTLKEIGQNDGHTLVAKQTITKKVNELIPECKDVYEEFVKETKMLTHSDGKFGLTLYHGQELYIYNKLKKLSEAKSNFTVDPDKALRELNKKIGYELTDEQKEAVRSTIDNNIVLITGRAGSGKTSSVMGIMELYSDYKIAQCALAARAARRMTEVTGYPASTIHKLLEWKGSKFERGEHNYLNYNVYVIDEASMINVWLFKSLLAAIPLGSKVILTGDAHQLPPIGAGNVFANLLEFDNKLTNTI